MGRFAQGRVWKQSGRSPALGVLLFPHCPHRTGKCSTSRTHQWPPALTSTLLTSTFQVSPSPALPGTLLPLGGHVQGRGLGAQWPRMVRLPLTRVCVSAPTAMAFITYVLVAGLALGTQDR